MFHKEKSLAGSYINGEWRLGDRDKLAVIDPATEKVIGTVAQGTMLDVKNSVDSAQDCFNNWKKVSGAERGEYLAKWYRLILKHKEQLAELLTLEQGKPISESLGEIDYAAKFVDYYANHCRKTEKIKVKSPHADASASVVRVPSGVTALITPWNFPTAMITRKASAAIAAGCTCVIHPSSETPFSALALAYLADQAKFPPGLFNVVVGKASIIVPEWVSDERVRVLSFTGSTKIGQMLYSQSASTMKRLVLELGGHAPFIVTRDADISTAVKNAVAAKFATSGQDCLAANRFYVHHTIYNEFCERLATAVSDLTVGPGINDFDIGPLINENAVAKQQQQVDDALAHGAKLMVGGQKSVKGPRFFEPTLLVDVSENSKIWTQETFGPVMGVAPYDNEADMIESVNSNPYGLIAYVNGNDDKHLQQIAQELQFGMIAINRVSVTGATIPFGGVKQSGLGREGGTFGLEEFTDLKYFCTNM